MTDLDFSSAKTAILGLGREGRAAWRYLRNRFPDMELTLIDEGSIDASFGGQLGDRDHLVHRPLSSAGLERFGIRVRSRAEWRGFARARGDHLHTSSSRRL